ncbi:ROK family protein [Echinicola marina]|uniref:ROK family protein n=1 Tax=Echinicola marina TaxID=2859768 RepID=UPI001CF672C7|nr:ROK family protein [Echinicola marina]UCS91808.1 ROK family protein [Echinicola marina]
MHANKVLGVDVGGSHITVGQVDLETRRLLDDKLVRQHVNSKGSEEEILRSWSKAIGQLMEDEKPSVRIGLAMPGPFDYEKGISWIGSTQDKYEVLYGKNIKELLASYLGIAPSQIKFKNDAACFLQGEIFAGAGKGYQRAIGMTLGTGAGTAYYHGTEAQDAARWGDQFGESIVEDHFSTRWFAKKYLEKTGKQLAGVKEMLDLADKEWVSSTFEEFGSLLGQYLNRFMEEESPEIVIIGGSISRSSDLFFPAVKNTLKEKNKKIPLVKSVLGEQGALIGAGSVWYEEAF